MTTHLQHFRETIDASNTDSCWEVFADFLDENGDERGAWVRRFAADYVVCAFSSNSAIERSGWWVPEWAWIRYEIPNAWEVFFVQYDPTPLDALLSLADACIAAESEKERVA